jgi:Peptidase family S41/Tricorn protease C1 domain
VPVSSGAFEEEKMKKNIILAVMASIFLFGCEEKILGPQPENTPKSKFEILWKELDQNYPLFDIKHINWDSLHTAYGSMISANTADSALWNIMGGLISHLDDGHVTLFDKGYSKWINSSEISKRPMNDFSLSLVESKFVSNWKPAGNGCFTYGKVNSSLTGKTIGYIHIASFALSGQDNTANWAFDIDKIMQELQGADAMIIDVRNNSGGASLTGNVIASVFIDREITYFYQQVKTGPGHNDLGSKIPLTISLRKGAPSFLKKIALLTNRFSASASEHFAQVYKNLSYSTQIGDTTFGAFGDVLKTAELPNGWTFRYPCRLTTTPDGYCPEGTGIIPDILVENTKADIDAGRDRVLQYAINYLSQ